jgi:hypothetical protein
VTDENEPRRRSTDREISQIDKRLGFLERDVEAVLKVQLPTIQGKLDMIRDAMAEPQASPLGRTLIERSIGNAALIRELEAQIDALNAWRNEMNGVAKFARVAQVLLGIAVALLALAQVFGLRG